MLVKIRCESKLETCLDNCSALRDFLFFLDFLLILYTILSEG
jgi:hypothetical protein